MNTADVLAALQSACEQVDPRELEPLSLETDLGTLGLDSVAILEMIAMSEDRLGIRIPDEAFGRVRTVSDLCAVFIAAAPPDLATQEGAR